MTTRLRYAALAAFALLATSCVCDTPFHSGHGHGYRNASHGYGGGCAPVRSYGHHRSHCAY